MILNIYLIVNDNSQEFNIISCFNLITINAQFYLIAFSFGLN